MKLGFILLSIMIFAVGCASKPALRETGFLGDYSKLTKVDDSRMRYISPSLKNYTAYMVDPIVMKVSAQKLDAKDRAEIANYFRTKLSDTLQKRNYKLVSNPGVGVARLRVAMTDVADSTWWKKVHPGMRLSGSGTGGAASEGEIIDSVSGDQLAAWVITDSASQFDFTAFSTVADVKNVIDRWATKVGDRLDETQAKKQG